MLNNQVIVTDTSLRAYARRNDQGIVDAASLTSGEWEEVRGRNANSTKAQLVQCAKCWELYREAQWLRTYSTSKGTRVVSHQPGESRPDHDYEPVETEEHRAWNSRAFVIGEAEGYNPRREAWAPNMKTRADVLLTGTLTIAYEHQHSPFSTTSRYSAAERTRQAAAVGRTAMWHATNDKVRGQVPILRTDGGLPPKVILNPNYRHEFRGGVYRIEIYTCTVREGYECPNRKFSGCGKPHARGQVTAGQLDDVLRGAPVGAYMPITDANVIRAPRFFWTDRHSYDQYVAYIAGTGPASLLNGAPRDLTKTRSGGRQGHSKAREAQLQAARKQSAPYPAAGACETGKPKCGQPARLYPAGWRCDQHKPSSHWFAR
ncbi:hypothetical protein [Streptomyces griseofuscus]|uniref:Uncharacterized protein n=1 Tax=Streptomyces griseofuscus TaxID=146922 RepID=A0A3R8R859_9ACTN|nr:hypothetical protein [Streptomyces griseofuscus]RRQ81517.1 hypothetical protein CQW44_30415 [Streptomyces griseofuscus]